LRAPSAFAPLPPAAESCDCALGHVSDFDPLGDVDLDGKRLLPFLLTSAARWLLSR
jgi:hypothetical protein